MNHNPFRISALAAFMLLFSATFCFAAAIDPATDWPAWRGPTRDGIAAPGQNPPIHWTETENIAWKTPVTGRGHSSPTVVGNQIFLATSDEAKGSQSILCFDRANGKLLWQKQIHAQSADPGHHNNSTAASSTVACDGDQLYINFLNNGAVHTTALARDGSKILWQQKICDYVTHQGFGASPVLHESLVLVAADHRGGGTIAALDRKSGKIVWTSPRPKIANYTTPAIIKAAGKTQMILGGCNLITSFDPLTGQKLWELPGSTEECVVTAVTDGTRVFTSGGYPRNHTVAVMTDGSKNIAWQNTTRAYVPSMICKDGHVYATLDAGMAICWKSDTGAELWKERLGGDFFASPVMVDDRIYAVNLAAKMFVFEATPKNFKLLAQNQLGDEAYASPAICGNRIYLRVAKRGNPRQEFLYCIADKASQVSR